MNNNMANGSIPSGSAPLYLGSFVSQRGAMAQKMTDRAIQLAEKEQTRQAKERADMLKALSFDAVQGLGRQVQEKHLEELNALQDKYAKRWIENGRKLTDRDYLDMQRDKTDMEQKIATYKGNVAQYAKVADEIRQGKVNYHPSTLEAMKKYYESGNVGEDFSQFVRYMPDTYGFLNKYTSQLGKLKPTLKERIDYENGKKITEGQLSQESVMSVLNPLLQNDPTYQALSNSDPYTKAQLDKSIGNYVQQFTQPTYREEVATKSELEASRMKSMPVKYRDAAEKYGWQDLSEGEIANAMYFNDFAKRILAHDKKALDLLMSKSLTNFGKPDSYEIDKDGGITLYSQADSKGNRKTHYIPPADTEDPDNMRQAMTSVLDIVPASMQGKQKPGNMQRIIVPEYEVDVKEKAPITAVANLQGYLDVPDSKVGIETSSGVKILASKERERLKENIAALLPDAKVEVEDPVLGAVRGKRPIKVDGVSYNMVNLKDRQALMDKVTSSMGIEPIVLQGGKIKSTTEKTKPVVDSESKNYTIKIGAEDSIAERHNNPGNLVWANQPGAEKGEPKEGGGYWAKFKSVEEGFNQLERQVNLDKERGLTLSQFIEKYAPKSENDTSTYLSNAEKALNVDKNTKLSDINTFDLASFIAKQESSTSIKVKQSEPEVIKITTQEEYDKLKPGDKYEFNGQVATKE